MFNVFPISQHLPRLQRLGLFVLLALCAGLRAGEVPHEDRAVTPPPTVPTTPNSGAMSDPTQMSPRMREMFAPKQAAPGAAPVLKPVLKTPTIVVRGLVIGKEGEGSAAIEIKNAGTWMVRSGSHLSVTVDGQNMTIVVKKISADGVAIEIPELEQYAQTLR